MIGNKQDAQIAFNIDHECVEMSEGWAFLGAGCSRNAYLSPEGVVYKVGDGEANRLEVRNSHRLRARAGKSELWRIPRANIHHVRNTSAETWPASRYVVAMEFVPSSDRSFHCAKWFGSDYAKCNCGQTPCIDEHRQVARRMFGISDLHDENVIVGQDGKFWIIDICY